MQRTNFAHGGLIGAAVLNTCLGSVVQKLIIADPEGSIPGLVVCPTVVGVAGHRGSVSFGSYLSYRQSPTKTGRVWTLDQLS